MVWKYIAVAVAAYLLGSVSTGLLVAHFSHGPDLRKVGSGNTGASNVLRSMGLRHGLITFLGDYAKAMLACAMGRWLIGDLYGAMLGGLFAVIGHNWPVFFGFRGGKGVASSVAVMLACFPIPALICYGLAVAVIAVTRFISLGSLTALVSFSVLVSLFWAHGDWLIILWTVLLAVFCIIRHRSNIDRLLHGTERKIGQKV